MAITPKVLYRAAAATGNATLATVPSGKTWVITNIMVDNSDTSASTFTLQLDDDSGSLVGLFTITPIAARTTVNIDLKQVLSAGRRIYGSAETTNIRWHISGVEIDN